MELCLQGTFEGTCFPYSIANAYLALKGKKPTSKFWDDGIKRLPFSEEFVTSRGTILYDDDLDMYRSAVERFLNNYASKKKRPFKVTLITEIKSTNQLLEHITRESVLIVNDRSEHWLCAVDFDESRGKVLFACSNQINQKGDRYCEKTSAKLARSFNFQKSGTSLKWLHKNIGIKVSLASD